MIYLFRGDGIFCTAAVEGDKIVKAVRLTGRLLCMSCDLLFVQEMNLKLPGRGSKPLRTAIKEHSPWKLKQVITS